MTSPGQGHFPAVRPRRLRRNAALRRLVAEHRLHPAQLVLPLFVRSGKRLRQAVGSMPGVFQTSPDEALREARRAAEAGLGGVLLFGIPNRKDVRASEAWARQGAVQRTIPLLKKELPELVVITDVCLCEYMSHGHCGVVSGKGASARILNDPSLKLLARTALSHAEAGADIVAPSDMMDGRVGAIRAALDQAGHEMVPIMSYAAKYASGFYGPFRDAAASAPQFGDRRSYQMDPANSEEAMREVAQDLAEGADMIMIKPALSCLDILYRVKSAYGLPTAAYAVSGEYSMIKAAARRGWIDERNVTMESLLAMHRAGADILVTYSALDAARWLGE